MALFFAPVANVVLSAVHPSEEGQASGANNAIREAGGAVLATVFGRYGGYESGQILIDGLSPAMYGGGVAFAGVLTALAIPRVARRTATPDAEPAEAVISRCACAGCWARSSDPHLEPTDTRAA